MRIVETKQARTTTVELTDAEVRQVYAALTHYDPNDPEGASINSDLWNEFGALKEELGL